MVICSVLVPSACFVSGCKTLGRNSDMRMIFGNVFSVLAPSAAFLVVYKTLGLKFGRENNVFCILLYYIL